MSEEYQALLDRFQGEVRDLEVLVRRIKRAWECASSSASEQDMFLDSVALGLHGFYSGLESLFLQIARRLDHNVPQGEGWQAQLLKQMRLESKMRPALISDFDVDFLDELRRFRHLVRNVYAFNLLPDRIEPLVQQVAEKWPKLRSELTAFEGYISSLLAITP